MKIIYYISLLLLSCTTSTDQGLKTVNHQSDLKYQIIPAAKGTYGYNIYINGKLLIHQPIKPAMEGDKGFSKKEDAGKVAQLVIKKLKRGEMPPSVTIEEMEELHIK